MLLQYGAAIDIPDKYSGTPLHYARMLSLMPDITEIQAKDFQISFYNNSTGRIDPWSVKQFEETLKVSWCPRYICDNYYIEELMFSGLSISKNQEFRAKYGEQIEVTSGDENLVLAKINDTVGYGVFAKKDLKKGDYIVRYGGYVMKADKVSSRSYSMASGLENIILDSSKFRNLGGMINHSDLMPNVQAECIFDQGVEQAVIIALEDIPKGYQLLLNYSDNYFGGTTKDFVELSQGDGFPTRLPESAFSDKE